jgi:secretion/DNA translocation related CpaE-like protein
MARTTAVRPALLVTADTALAGSVSRLAAAAGVRLGVVAGPREALQLWNAAAAVLVGPDVVEDLVAASAPRRAEVHVVATGTVPDAVYRSALRLGADAVLELPGAGPRLLEALADLCDGGVQPGTSVAVVGASGGAGASVLAAALATVASRDSDVLLLDLDPLGPGQRLLVGHEEGAGISWQDLAVSSGRLGARSLREAVPRRQRLGVLGWSGDVQDRFSPGLAGEAVAAAVRGHRWVVLDVPRRAEDDVRGVLAACDHTVVVASARTGSLAAAARFTRTVRLAAPAAGLVVRTHRDAPSASAVARALGMESWAEMRDERRLDEHLALGLGAAHSRRGPLARAAALVLARCATTRGRAAA